MKKSLRVCLVALLMLIGVAQASPSFAQVVVVQRHPYRRPYRAYPHRPYRRPYAYRRPYHRPYVRPYRRY